ncbi:MAG: hypothetical protein RLZZ238_2264, partial [Planctomycetota bacterium]
MRTPTSLFIAIAASTAAVTASHSVRADDDLVLWGKNRATNSRFLAPITQISAGIGHTAFLLD